jgi:alkylhydroperoxidase family enzyme
MNQQDLLQPAAGWAAPQDTRLPPPPPRERGLLFRTLALASRWFGRPELPHIFPVLNINRRIFPAWLFFASRMMPFGKLPATVREKLILRVAWNCRSRYEWGQHAEIALRVGVTDEEIAAIARDQDAGNTEDDKLLVHACDQLCRNKLIDDDTWRQLEARFSPPELVELIMLVGHYEMVAGLLVNAGIALEAPIEEALQALYQRLRSRLS